MDKVNRIIKKTKGSIVNIGSIVGNNGFSELSGYASTKTALIGLTKSFAVEMAKDNIRANLVNPGFIKTSYFEKFKKKSETMVEFFILSFTLIPFVLILIQPDLGSSLIILFEL